MTEIYVIQIDKPDGSKAYHKSSIGCLNTVGNVQGAYHYRYYWRALEARDKLIERGLTTDGESCVGVDQTAIREGWQS